MEVLLASRNDNKSSHTDELTCELLKQINPELPENKNILIIGITNFIWKIDDAFYRRFESRVYIKMPNLEFRKKIIEFILKGRNHNLSKFDISKVCGGITHCYSPSDIKNLLNFSSNICRDKKMAFTHFTKIPVSKMLCFKEVCEQWHIALPDSDPQNVVTKSELEKTFPDFSEKDICNPPLSFSDIKYAKTYVPRTISPDKLTKFVVFADKEFKIDICETLAAKEKPKQDKDYDKNVLVKNEHTHTHVHKSK